jgi:hypothetical protein
MLTVRCVIVWLNLLGHLNPRSGTQAFLRSFLLATTRRSGTSEPFSRSSSRRALSRLTPSRRNTRRHRGRSIGHTDMTKPAFGISTLGAFGISPLGICGYEWNDDGNRGEGWIASTSIPYGPAFAFYLVLFFSLPIVSNSYTPGCCWLKWYHFWLVAESSLFS